MSTLKDCLKSGKPFKLPNWIAYITKDDPQFNDILVNIIDDGELDLILGDTWILKYDCETCKDTKSILIEEPYSGGIPYIRRYKPCPDCSTLKYKHDVFCNASRDFPQHTPGKGCSCHEFHYKCRHCHDTKEVEQFLMGQKIKPLPCPKCSEPPKMKKITVYRPIIDDKVGFYLRATCWSQDKEHWNDTENIVGWDEEVIEVLDEEPK
jgi:predicted nucleic acid-binding Zn ribbon protein